ncbi:type II secretion system F family protein [Vibrio olivae]|uniref:Type II secretion system F family protein n=1 Tax=Vibrio olivae TaxID=1243002 RepID=A0ABV5HM64_9VIBR
MNLTLYIALTGATVCLTLSVFFYYRSVHNPVTKQRKSSSQHSQTTFTNSQKWWRRSKNQHHRFLENVVTNMRQAGYISSREQILCLFKIAVVWAALFLIFSGQQLLSATSITEIILYSILFFAFGMLITIRWLRSQAIKRGRIIDEEMLIAVHLMSILWQVGLSVESLFKAYKYEAGELTPEINKEVSLILARIDAGQNREWVFKDMAALSLSSGFQDLLTMLSQASDSGGGLKQSFQSLSGLLYERKRVELQEKVTKMSGKISVTMMALMFPALFIVLGGPAALALMSAFGG